MRPWTVERLGLLDYGAALALQEARHAEVCAGRRDDTLLLVQHPPVVTTGRNTQPGHVLLSPEALALRGVASYATGRGGDVTYHAPGQLVGYPILALQEHERDVRAYVGRLEALLIGVAADFGVVAERLPGLRGIWVGNDKLAAIGVRLSQWTTLHGFALNVSLDLTGFDCIVPCGLHGRGVTSLTRLLGRPVDMDEVQARTLHHAEAQLGRRRQANLAAASHAPPERHEEVRT